MKNATEGKVNKEPGPRTSGGKKLTLEEIVRIRNTLKNKGMPITELAREIGVRNSQQLYHYLQATRHQTPIPAEYLIKIYETLGMDEEYKLLTNPTEVHRILIVNEKWDLLLESYLERLSYSFHHSKEPDKGRMIADIVELLDKYCQ